MNTIEALQGLYKKLGGDAEDVAELTTIPEMVDAITSRVDAGGGGGSDLPEVTSADNGKNLSVIDGEWNTNEPFVMTYMPSGYDSSSGFTTLTCDKTLQEIFEAKNLGREIEARLDWDDGVYPSLYINEMYEDEYECYLRGFASAFGSYFEIEHFVSKAAPESEEVRLLCVSTLAFLVNDNTEGATLKCINGDLGLFRPLVATYTPTGATTATCDKTFSEIKAAIENGQEVVGVASMTDGTATITVQLRYDGNGVDGDDGALYFSGTIFDKLITVAHRYTSGVESVEFAQYTLS